MHCSCYSMFNFEEVNVGCVKKLLKIYLAYFCICRILMQSLTQLMFCFLGCYSKYYSEADFNDGQEQATQANHYFHNMNTNLGYGVPLRRSLRVADNNVDCRELIKRKRALRSSTRLGVQSNLVLQSSSKDRPQLEGEKPTKYHNINRYQWHRSKAEKGHNDRHLKNEDSANDETNVTTRIHTRHSSKQKAEKEKGSKDTTSSDKKYSMRTRSKKRHSLRQKDSSSSRDKERSEKRRKREIETKQKSQNDKNRRERRENFRKDERGKLEEVHKKEDVRIVEERGKGKDSSIETSKKLLEKNIKSENNLSQKKSQNNNGEQKEEIEIKDKGEKGSIEKSSPFILSPISSSESTEDLETGNSEITLDSSIDRKEGDTQVKQDEEQCSEDWVVISELSEKHARSNSTKTVETDFGDDFRNSLKVIDEYIDEEISSDRPESDTASEPSEISDKIESIVDCSSNQDTISELKEDAVGEHYSESKSSEVSDTVVNEESGRFSVSHKVEARRKEETKIDSQILGEFNLNIGEKSDPSKENEIHELVQRSSSPQVVLDKAKVSVISSGQHSYLSSMHLSPVSSNGNESENERSREINEKPTTVEKGKLMKKLRLRSMISNKYKTIRIKSMKKSLRICGSKFKKKNYDKSRGVRKMGRQHLKQLAKDSSVKHSSAAITKRKKTVLRFQSSQQFPRSGTGKKTSSNATHSEASNIKQVEKDTKKKSTNENISENSSVKSHKSRSDFIKELDWENIPNTSKKCSHKVETTVQLNKPNESHSNENNPSLIESNLTEKQIGIQSSDHQQVDSIESKEKLHIDMKKNKVIGKQLKHGTYAKESSELSSNNLNSYEIPNDSSHRKESQRDGESSKVEGVSTHESRKNNPSPALQKKTQVNIDQDKNGTNCEQENNQVGNEPKFHQSNRMIFSSGDKCDKANDHVREPDKVEATENDNRLKSKTLNGKSESYDDIEVNKIDTKHEIKSDTLIKPLLIQTAENDQSSPNKSKCNVANKPLNKDNDMKTLNTTKPTQLKPIEKKDFNSADLIPRVSTTSSFDSKQQPKTENCNILAPSKSISTAAPEESTQKLNESPETADTAFSKDKLSETSRQYLNGEGKETESVGVASETATQTNFKAILTKPKPTEKEVLTCNKKGNTSESINNTSENMSKKSRDQIVNKPTPKASEASRKTEISATKSLTKIDAVETLVTTPKLSNKKQEVEKACISTGEKSKNLNEILPDTSNSSKNAEICTTDYIKTVSLKNVVVTKGPVEKQETSYDKISTSEKSKGKTITETPLISSDENRETETTGSSDLFEISQSVKGEVLFKRCEFGVDGIDISEKSKQQSMSKMQPKLSESIENTKNLTSSDLSKTTPLDSIAVNVKIHVGKQSDSHDSINTSEKAKERRIIEIIPNSSQSNKKPEDFSAVATEKSKYHSESEVPPKGSGLNREMKHSTTAFIQTTSSAKIVDSGSSIEEQSTNKDGPNTAIKPKEQTFSETPQKSLGMKRKLDVLSKADLGEMAVTENTVLNCKLIVEKQQICKDSTPDKSKEQAVSISEEKSSRFKAITDTSAAVSVKVATSENNTVRSEDPVERPVSKPSLQLKTVSIIDRGLLSFIPKIASSASSDESTPEYALPGITKVSAAYSQFMNPENKTLNIKKVSEKKESFLLIDRGIKGSSRVENDIKTFTTALKKASPKKVEIVDCGKISKKYAAEYALNSNFSKDCSSPQESTKNPKENCDYTLTDFDFSAIREIFDKNPFLADSAGANGESQNKSSSADTKVPTTGCSSTTVEDSSDITSVRMKSKRNNYPAMGANENENIENEKLKRIHQASRRNISAENTGDNTEPPKKVKKRVRFEGAFSDSEKPSSESDSSTKRSSSFLSFPNNLQTKGGSQRKTLVENISSVIHKNHEREILKKSSRLIERPGNDLEKSSKEYPNVTKNVRSPTQRDNSADTNPNEKSLSKPSSSTSQKSIETSKTSNQSNKLTFASHVTSNINSCSSFATSQKNSSSIKSNISEETLNNKSHVSSSMQLTTTVPFSSQPLHATTKPTHTQSHPSNSSSTYYSNMVTTTTPPWPISYPHQSSYMYPMNQGR